jgi:hypothetical protein
MNKTISKILDNHCPIKTTKVRVDKPLWMSDTLDKVICAKNEASDKRKENLSGKPSTKTKALKPGGTL